MAGRRRKKQPLKVESLTHDEAGRTNIPTAEHQPLMKDDERDPIEAAFERRNPDLDPQLIWRGKDTSDWSDLETTAPPLYIQEKVHPQVLIRHLMRTSGEWRVKSGEREDGELSTDHSSLSTQIGFADLFADFNGLPDNADRTDFYQHEANWSNRMILGDSLSVMASLAEREGLRGKVQCIYIDPPYGIRFNSNFQWSTTSRDVRDGKREHITREPEQVKAFRDTWRDGIHSYLTYLRDRLTVARDLLSDSGSIFVQIGDSNAHRVRALMDEVFGEDSFVSDIAFTTTIQQTSSYLPSVFDHVFWFSKAKGRLKYRRLLNVKVAGEPGATRYDFARTEDLFDFRIGGNRKIPADARVFTTGDLTSQEFRTDTSVPFRFQYEDFVPGARRHWNVAMSGMPRLARAQRIRKEGNNLRAIRFLDDNPAFPITNVWTDTMGIQSRSDPRVYVVQTSASVIQRCILMATDPGDLVLDPTCGSGTTAYVAEQWGRRWITIDTSRVALALARARIMGARYPWYLLADSPEGQLKEADVERRAPSESPTYGDIRQGFVYQRVPHITLRAIANNVEIDVIWEQFEERLAPLRGQLSVASGQVRTLEEWEVSREPPDDWPAAAHKPLAAFWEARIARQKEIDASIAAKADFEYLYDKPYQEKRTVRVAGPFTVESLSPHRILGVDAHGELIDKAAEATGRYGEPQDFASMVLDNLRTAGVQQAHKEDRIKFDSLTPWPGDHVCAEGRYQEGGDTGRQRRAGVFIGPEFGTVQRQDLVEAAREAADADFDLLIACAFNYEAHATEFDKLGRIPILKARMNADLHMAGELKNTGQGNLFVIFGEPDIDVLDAGEGQIKVKVNGVDVFDPSAGTVRSDDTDGIACWFIDTDYDSESFFVRHAYFLGANDPYKSLKRTLKAEVDAEAWATLHSDTSRPFDKPESGRIA